MDSCLPTLLSRSKRTRRESKQRRTRLAPTSSSREKPRIRNDGSVDENWPRAPCGEWRRRRKCQSSRHGQTLLDRPAQAAQRLCHPTPCWRSLFFLICCPPHLVSSISSTLCNNSSKPPELVEAIERAAVSTVRLYEFLANKAVEGIATSLSEFLHGVLRKFLANPSRMNISDRSWTIAKHVLNLCVTTSLSADILMSLKATLLNIQMEFLRMWMTTKGVREMRFVDFACTEMDELQARLHQRVFSNAFGFSAL